MQHLLNLEHELIIELLCDDANWLCPVNLHSLCCTHRGAHDKPEHLSWRRLLPQLEHKARQVSWVGEATSDEWPHMSRSMVDLPMVLGGNGSNSAPQPGRHAHSAPVCKLHCKHWCMLFMGSDERKRVVHAWQNASLPKEGGDCILRFSKPQIGRAVVLWKQGMQCHSW